MVVSGKFSSVKAQKETGYVFPNTG